MSTDNPNVISNNLNDFVQIYNSASSQNKKNILIVLGKTLEESSIPLLIRGLGEYDSSISDIARDSLLSLKIEGISFSSCNLADFEQIYNYTSEQTKRNILDIVGKIIGESSIPLLMTGLGEYNSSISDTANNSLLYLKTEGISFSSYNSTYFEQIYIRANSQKKIKILELVAKILRESSIPLLITGLGEYDSSISDAARDNLLYLKTEGVSFSSYSLADFEQIYNSANSQKKIKILELLAKILRESSIPLLIDGLGKYDSSISDAARDNLLYLEIQRVSFSSYSLADFEQIYNFANEQTKKNILKVVGNILKETSIPLLMKGLGEYNSSISDIARNSLLYLKTEGISFSSYSLTDFEQIYIRVNSQNKIKILELVTKIFGESSAPLLITGLGEYDSSISDTARDLFSSLSDKGKSSLKNKTYDEDKKEREAVKIPEDSEVNKNNFSQNEFKYDVALSFAGENREIVHSIAKKLQEKQISVFYDEFEKTDLWGKKLPDYFKLTYGKNTRFVVPFISNEYSLKDWTNFELTIARGEAKNREEEFILPVRLDDTLILGLHEDIGYLHFNKEGVDGIVKALIDKLKK